VCFYSKNSSNEESGIFIIFTSILLSFFPCNLFCDSLGTSYSPYEDTSKVIITHIYKKSINQLEKMLLEQSNDYDSNSFDTSSNFLGLPSPNNFTTTSLEGPDQSLRKYLGLEQIEALTSITSSNYKVVIFDHLVDFKHDDLEDAIHKVVLLPNDYSSEIKEYNRTQLAEKTPYDDEFIDYINSSRLPSYYGHGTAIAGIVQQIAPMVDIISVAMMRNISFSSLKPTIIRFLKWLEDNEDQNFIINISSSWSEALLSIDMDPSSEGSVADRILGLVYDDSTSSYKNHLFVCSAGNSQVVDLLFPANLANAYDSSSWTDDIDGKLDISMENPAKANGIISVATIKHEGSDIGLREDSFSYDIDGNGDLELMAPGIELLTTYPTQNPYTSKTNYTLASGTSYSSPIVSALAALISSESLAGTLSAVELEMQITQNAIYDSSVYYVPVLGVHRHVLKYYGHGMVNFIQTLGKYDYNLKNLDYDDDDLEDVDELYNYRTDPLISDTDGDTLLDGDEINRYSTDPLVADFNLDSDNDGLTNVEEVDTYFTDPHDIDSDDDELPDGWEVLNGYNPTVSNGLDPDNDGLTNSEELQYSTNPFAADSDNDGLNDYVEIFTYNTNPLDNDTDDDDLPDGWEVQFGLLPTSATGENGKLGDFDLDGLSNYEEYTVGTYPNDPDCDNDGLNDYQEVYPHTDTYITNPFNPDTDGDTIDDFEETHWGNDAFLSDPTSSDGDNDGISDVEEVSTGTDGYITDPMDPDTDGDQISDYYEIITYGTNPNDVDTDDDQLTDYQEIMIEGTNPNDYDTDNDGYSDGFECDIIRNWDPINPFDPNSQPENVEVIQQSDSTKLYLSWDEMSGITLYRVDYIANGDPNWISVNTTNSFLLLTGLEEGTEYLFMIYALSNYNDCWSGGNYEFGWTRQPQPDITILTLSNYVDITIEFTLTDSATEIELWWRIEGEVDFVLYGTYYSSGSVTIENLDIDTWYYFKTRQRVAGSGWQDDYWSVYSYETSIQTTNEPTPLNVRYFVGNPSGTVRVTFTWVKPTNWLLGWTYYVWRKPASGGEYTLIKVTESHSFNHYPPNPNTLYTYKITCFNNDGVNGPYSYWTGKAATDGGGGGGPQ
jgi:hypothetical protein